MSTNDDEAAAVAVVDQLITASVVPMVLKAAIELDLLEIIAKEGPGATLSAAEIASQLPTSNPSAAAVMVDRMMRLLASYSVLKCSLRPLPGGGDERLYGVGPVCKYLTRNEDSVSFSSICLMNQDRVSMESWYHLKDAVLEGGVPFNKAHGMNAFEYNRIDPRFNNIFNRGMSDHSTITTKKLLETYKGFEALNSLVDVGGGTGTILSMIISKYPSIKGINFDLPHVIQDAPPHQGLQHVGGDMFASVPKGDAVFMKWILHDWSDESCSKLLKNCYRALPENGKVIVVENILPRTVDDTSVATKVVFHIDVLMLANNPGGKERTEDEFQSLAMSSGFKGFRVVCRVFNMFVMEFLKIN